MDFLNQNVSNPLLLEHPDGKKKALRNTQNFGMG